ncbi:CheY-like chemotaxis protein [Deinobacterium chartae]|uniref:CheY-like chemotaxis protein n=1 Tax=Deinobacterium chartae TaxID=521158 RepID=A0A841HVZ2_9DEIO|nr:response regulator [Deinobacterium chartae]MBB6097557.1 CheY-like chemotaxis protein [Deinobacterium chartae]
MIEILLVEDNPADVLLTREAFEEARIANRLSHVSDGEEALAFLRRKGEFSGATRPDLILLDLNMPRMGGLELLDELKRDPELRAIPVIVLTTSAAEADVWRSYHLHANAYITKPVSMADFFEVVKTFEDFWMALVRLPKTQQPS